MTPALEAIDRWPVEHAAAGYRTNDGTVRTRGQSSRRFPLASVTKPLFTLAVLVSIEEGTLALDQPAGPHGSTIRHLLAHASGLGPDAGSPVVAPGTRRIYSNWGFEMLGAELAAASDMPAAEYFRLAVVEPLHLTGTALDGSPAHGASSTIDDVLAIAAELLSPTLISPETLTEAVTPQFPGLSGVLPGFGRQKPNPWGLGFEVRGRKRPHWTGHTNSPATFGHFGRAGTLLWVDPEAGVACVALTDQPFGPWAARAWPWLSDQILDEAAAGSRR